MYCRHVYEYVYSRICPDCNGDTHEPDYKKDHELFVEHYETGQHLSYKCPVEGGTIRGWWSI